MDSLKNKQAAKNRQEKIRKVATLRAQGRGSSAMPLHVSKKRKYPSEFQSSRKIATGLSTYSKPREVVANAPCYGIRKGLMTSQGPLTPPPFPLLMKDKEYAVGTTHSIV